MKATRRSALALVALGLLAFASPAAADRIYFGSNSTVSYAALDGSGGANLPIGSSVGHSEVRGIAIDPAAGKIYWASGSGAASRISSANLDGSNAADLPITGAPLNSPRGVALDLAAGRIYWGNYQGPGEERIGYANLDGSGGGHLSTTGATAGNISGVGIHPAAGRIYWANESGSIAFASLDGSGGDDVNLIGASVSARHFGGVAVDASTQRIYWTSTEVAIPYEALISYAALDESGGSDLATPGTSFLFPEGVAIDAAASRAYWANTAAFSGTGSISYGALDGSGGGNLNLAGATITPGIAYPALLKAPVASGAPKLNAQIALRPRFLTCDEGTWAGDMPEAQLYRAPHSLSYQWLKDGQPVPGATRSNIGVEGTPGGDYACQVTATNAGGSTTQTSRAQFVCCPVSPKAKGARVALVKGGKALLKLTCPDGVEPCAGRLHLESTRPPRRSAGSSARKGPKIPNLPVIYGERSISIPGGDQQVVKVKLSRRAKSQLRKSKRHRLKAVLDGRAVETRTVLLKLAKKRPKRR